MKIVMNRRDFLKYSIGGVATVVMGSRIPGFLVNEALAAVQTLNVTITDALKDMVTDNPGNPAKCYFWVYKMSADDVDISAEVPGPNIFTTKGDTVNISITNALDEPHAFSIPGIFDSGPIAPGQTKELSFTAAKSGTFLYHDNLNPPVNRVMGLHGAFIVMPAAPAAGHKFTPYDSPTQEVQELFDDLGSAPQWPGLAWEDGDTNQESFAPPFRQYIWLVHQASPNLFEQVGSLPAGEIFDSTTFVNAFLRDPFNSVNADVTVNGSRTPQYFTINGQSGHFSHNNPFICPNLRVGEPCVIRVLNAGLMSHSLHIHANHVFVIGVKGTELYRVPTNLDGVAINPIWVDTFTANPMDIWEWLNPYMRPPDVPNLRGIGNIDIPSGADRPLPVESTPIPGFGTGGGPTPAGVTTWPPIQELDMHMPQVGNSAEVIPIDVQLSPLCYPMHDHSEPSQTSQGGNYNLGLISGMNFTGDRATPGGVITFPNEPDVFGPDRTKLLEPAAGPEE